MKIRTLLKTIGIVSLCLVMAEFTVKNANAQSNITVRTFTNLLPPDPAPDGVSPNGHGKAIAETVNSSTSLLSEKLKVEVQDVAVIEDPLDPEVGNGFYIVSLYNLEKTVSYPLPVFPGFIVKAVDPTNPNGPTKGTFNVAVKPPKGQPPLDLRGKMICIWEVKPVRDPITGVAIQGPNGEPFVIDEELHSALQGVFTSR